MLYQYAKRYPLIGVTTEIPTNDPPYLNPVDGFTPALGDMTAIDFDNDMYMTNLRGKYFVVFMNTDDSSEDLIVTPVVTALVAGYEPIQAPITILAGSICTVGPFSAKYETEGVVNFTFSGASTSGLCIVGRIT